MATDDTLERRVGELEQAVEELEEKLRKTVRAGEVGSKDEATSGLFLQDGTTRNSVAKVDYDSSSGALRVTKVR